MHKCMQNSFEVVWYSACCTDVDTKLQTESFSHYKDRYVDDF
jgi:hypothetical protein